MKLKVSYKPMEITLIKRDKKKQDLKRDLRISGSTIAKMSNGELVAMSIVLRICEYLNCPIQDVVEFVEDNNNE
ncbi:helix-turn-helix transcriptional regulator [Bacillus subtilis]|uniref:helix-turn-helix domain-containing protein n=1 Tax=Bacillus subtilis TaxID=1423 RepID=UPI002DBC9275|nr:helix-turn-helix transcriptional regulator [Bacillus subtilis]MEC2335139.1 helix-turn-helix transcriptional regulator [Bacillus subtilis]